MTVASSPSSGAASWMGCLCRVEVFGFFPVSVPMRRIISFCSSIVMSWLVKKTTPRCETKVARSLRYSSELGARRRVRICTDASGKRVPICGVSSRDSNCERLPRYDAEGVAMVVICSRCPQTSALFNLLCLVSASNSCRSRARVAPSDEQRYRLSSRDLYGSRSQLTSAA